MSTLSITTKYIVSRIKGHDFAKKPLIIGINGPQGSGKSYLTNQLTNYLRETFPRFNTVQFSMDDLYLTRQDQDKLNNSTDNPLLKGRGLPGTHDLPALYEIFDKATRNYKGNWEEIRIPQYDKSRFNGQGDRSGYTVVDSPIDIIIFEGWFNGYANHANDILRLRYLTSEVSGVLQLSKMYHLEEINANLSGYQDIWTYFDVFITLKTNDVKNVYAWRLQQEHESILKNGSGMTDEEVTQFVNRYMPVYLLYYDDLCEHGLKGCDYNLIISIDLNRQVIP
ncbi:putative ATP-dependent kinase TDA10 [Candida viswanathii]|uniref:Putative ATP-dependent kinase TDA10 n=1 Tax=Candida viswanathii TaxID=5486 RepID=A0A367YJC3_9ASCO|nr:putative ATP-dependent kinase TDA10 [Candida viswanathii]